LIFKQFYRPTTSTSRPTIVYDCPFYGT